MKNTVMVSLVVSLIVALGQVTTVWGFGVLRTRTEAAIVDPSAADPAVQLGLRAELLNGVPELTRSEVVVTWEHVGGVGPSPFRVVIPAGCFVPVRGVYVVESFRVCGVSVTFVDGGDLSIGDFAARLLPRRDGNTGLEVRALIMVGAGNRLGAPAILGALGGAAVGIAIGTEGDVSLPLGIESVSGIQPTPF